MDWIEEFIFGTDYQQTRNLRKLKEEVRISNSLSDTRTYTLEARVDKLERENDELKLACLALLKTLVNHDLVTKESFLQLIQQIDAEDGKQNGRYEGSILPEPEPRPKSEIKINFSSLTKKPDSSNS